MSPSGRYSHPAWRASNCWKAGIPLPVKRLRARPRVLGAGTPRRKGGFIPNLSPPPVVSWEARLDAPYAAHVRRRHLRAIGGLLLLPLGVVLLLLFPWQRATDEVLWIGIYLVAGLALAVPGAQRLWGGENEPDPLPPGPNER